MCLLASIFKILENLLLHMEGVIYLHSFFRFYQVTIKSMVIMLQLEPMRILWLLV